MLARLSGGSVFVNGRSRSIVMDDMRARIDRGNIRIERVEAIQVCLTFRRFSVMFSY